MSCDLYVKIRNASGLGTNCLYRQCDITVYSVCILKLQRTILNKQVSSYKCCGRLGWVGCVVFEPCHHLSRCALHLHHPALVRAAILASATVALLLVRIYFIGGGTPTFIDSDNPASFSPHFQTRLLTYSYLCAVNAWLLLCPSRLCHDWSMGSVPLVNSINDRRNFATLLLAVSAALLAWRG